MAEPGFELVSIALTKAEFQRPVELNFIEEEVATTTGFKVSFYTEDEPEPRLIVSLSVSVGVPTGIEDEPMSASATMLGIFHINGNLDIDAIKSFGNVNAPAILYPFAREVIANLTMKANVPPVLLPTMNFVAAHRQSQLAKKAESDKAVKASAKRKAISSSKLKVKPTAKE